MDRLPVEKLEEIFQRMSYEDINSCVSVCRRWRSTIRNRRARTRLVLEPSVEGIASFTLRRGRVPATVTRTEGMDPEVGVSLPHRRTGGVLKVYRYLNRLFQGYRPIAMGF